MAAASWGLGDFAGGIATRLSNGFVSVFLSQAVGLLLVVALSVAAAEPMPGRESLAWGALGGISGSLGLGCFYLALSRGTMGLVAPLTALLAASWPAALALATGGGVSRLGLLGMGTALAAVLLISLPDRRLGTPVLPTFHGSRGQEWLLVLCASLGFGGFFLFVDAARDAGGAVWWPLLMVKLAGVLTLIAAAMVLAPLGRFPGLRLGRAALVIGCIAGLGDLGGNLFFVLASGEGSLAVVIVLVSLYPVWTAILARLFLHERLSRLRLLGVGLAVASVALIGLGS